MANWRPNPHFAKILGGPKMALQVASIPGSHVAVSRRGGGTELGVMGPGLGPTVVFS